MKKRRIQFRNFFRRDGFSRRDSLERRSGETIVEIVVSMLLFLLLLALLQGAISFAGAAIRRSRQIREDNATVAAMLRSGSPENVGSAKLYFYAVRSDGSEIAQSPSFSMDVLLNQRVLNYREDHTRTYALYGSSKAESTDEDGSTEENSAGMDENSSGEEITP